MAPSSPETVRGPSEAPCVHRPCRTKGQRELPVGKANAGMEVASSKQAKRRSEGSSVRGNPTLPGRTPVLGVSGSGHMGRGTFKHPELHRGKRRPELRKGGRSRAKTGRPERPSPIWPLPETLNTFGRDCARSLRAESRVLDPGLGPGFGPALPFPTPRSARPSLALRALLGLALAARRWGRATYLPHRTAKSQEPETFL